MTFLNVLILLLVLLITHHLITYPIIYFFVKFIFCLPLLECKLHKGRDFIYCITYELRTVPGTADVQ